MLEIACALVFEGVFTSAAQYDNPLRDVALVVTFTAPDGRQQKVDGFWDGGRTFRVRFCPEVEGEWAWESSCSNTADEGLHGRRGSFRCIPYSGDNALYRHGSITLSQNRRYLQHRDGTPFFWLADTAWNGALKSTAEEWEEYLRTRAAQRFTAAQVVMTQWRANDTDRVFTLEGGLRVLPEVFQRLDARLEAMNRHGLVAAPVMLWALTKDDPGVYLSEEDAIALGRYQQARWGAYQVVWLLGGDGRYTQGDVTRWHRIGRGIFGDPAESALQHRLVTMHPAGQTWVVEEFRHEPWFGFHGYQSGHGDSDPHLNWLLKGPPGRPWQTEPVHPVINLEPNYETHPAYQSRERFTAYHVRRAAYWSLLVTPTAGVTYGNNAIWWWGNEPQVPLGHAALGVVQPWREGLDLPGTQQMTILREFFEGIAWWTLKPAPELLLGQPAVEPARRVVLAANEERTLAVGYLPCGGKVSVGRELEGLRKRWFDPRTGAWREAEALEAPDGQDWVLVVGE